MFWKDLPHNLDSLWSRTRVGGAGQLHDGVTMKVKVGSHTRTHRQRSTAGTRAEPGAEDHHQLGGVSCHLNLESIAIRHNTHV